jgi:hypothetical protein
MLKRVRIPPATMDPPGCPPRPQLRIRTPTPSPEEEEDYAFDMEEGQFLNRYNPRYFLLKREADAPQGDTICAVIGFVILLILLWLLLAPFRVSES